MLQPGDHVGRYEIQRRLGRGGMGTVYVAHDPVLGRLVALKLFAGDLDAADAAVTFAREARAAAALNHANIVTIYDFGEFEAQPFIVMEYIQGETVARIIRKKAELPLSDRLRILEELCAGVAYAHGFEVIHRDIKPANLILDRANRLKILDFGIARILGTSMSKATAMIGTPGYMAPEQIRGGLPDRRSDLFSIGAVAYELLSYSEAFAGDSVPAITHRILTDEPAPLSELVADIPAGLVTVVERALRKDPAERFADAASLGFAIAEMRRDVEGDPRYRTLVRTRPYPDAAGDRGTAPDAESKRPLSESGRTTPIDPSARREELVRRRTEKIAAALGRAHSLFEEGRLPEAHEACLEALTIDEANPEALQLEVDISARVTRLRVQELTGLGRAALARGAFAESEDTLRQIRELDARAPEVRMLERELRARRNEQTVAAEIAESFQRAIERARAGLEGGDVDGAWRAARQALLLVPDSDEARRLEAEAQRRIDAEVGGGDTVVSAPAPGEVAPTIIAPAAAAQRATVPVPSPPQSSAPPEPVHQARAAHADRAVAAVHTAREAMARQSATAWRAVAGVWARSWRWARTATTAWPHRAAQRPLVSRASIAWTAAGLVLAISASALVFLKASPAPAQPGYGTVSVDALPWATVVAVVGADGARVALPADASTPLTLRLPAGVYRLTLAGPSTDFSARELTITVAEGKNAVVDGGRFGALTADTYFEPYLLAAPEGSR